MSVRPPENDSRCGYTRCIARGIRSAAIGTRSHSSRNATGEGYRQRPRVPNRESAPDPFDQRRKPTQDARHAPRKRSRHSPLLISVHPHRFIFRPDSVQRCSRTTRIGASEFPLDRARESLQTLGIDGRHERRRNSSIARGIYE